MQKYSIAVTAFLAALATTGVLGQSPAAPANLRFLGNAGPASFVKVASGAPQGAVVNTTYRAPLRVLVLDTKSYAVSGVSVTFTAPGSGASGLFNGGLSATVSTDSTGIAAAPPLTANGTSGTFAVVASASGAGQTSFFLTNTPVGGAAGTWVNITPPQIPSMANCTDPQYGMQVVGLSPANPSIVYVGTCYHGVYKTGDGGATWTKINTGVNGGSLDQGRNWTLAVDPTDPNTVYTVAGYGAQQGIFKSTNGGVDWAQMMPTSLSNQTTADIYSIAIDPRNHLHLLVGSHSGWNFGSDAGVLESLDGGQSWIQHAPQAGWGAGHYLFFLGRDDAGVASSTAWILATQSNGFWRTLNSGANWTQVSSSEQMQHGAGQLYRTAAGILYMGAARHLLRSTDNGRSWTAVGPTTQDGYNAVVGDGVYLYIQAANTGLASSGAHPYYFSLEADGVTWQPFNGQTFLDGPMSMVFDPQNHIIYSSNWCAGLWKLVTGR